MSRYYVHDGHMFGLRPEFLSPWVVFLLKKYNLIEKNRETGKWLFLNPGSDEDKYRLESIAGLFGLVKQGLLTVTFEDAHEPIITASTEQVKVIQELGRKYHEEEKRFKESKHE